MAAKEYTAHQPKFQYLDTDKKNRINQLTEAYFGHMKENSEVYFERIRKFLSDPINADIQRAYENAAAEIDNKVAIRRDQFGAFEALDSRELCVFPFKTGFAAPLSELISGNRNVSEGCVE